AGDPAVPDRDAEPTRAGKGPGPVPGRADPDRSGVGARARDRARPAGPPRLTRASAVAQILDGKVVAAKVQAAVAEGVGALYARGVRPVLAVVLVGDAPASKVYIGGKRRACHAVGIGARDHLFPGGLAEADLL